MSNRPLVTKELTDAVESLLNPYHDTRIYIAKEVTFDYRTEQACRVDLMRFKPINNTVMKLNHQSKIFIAKTVTISLEIIITM